MICVTLRPMKAYAILLAAVFQIFGSNAPMVFEWGTSISERSAEANAIITPPGFAFSIWGPIFLSCLLYGFYAVAKRRTLPTLIQKTAWPSVGIFTLAGLWGLWVPFNGTDGVSLVIIILAAVLGLRLMYQIGDPKVYSRSLNGLVIFPIALISGWLITASAIAVLSAINVHQLSMIDTESFAVVVPLLFVLVASVALTVYKTKNFWYGIAPVWGLSALAIGKLGADIDTEIGVVSLVGAVVVAVVSGYRLVR